MRKNLSITPFQTFFVSKEESACPLIPEIMRFGKSLDKLNLETDDEVSISAAYGKRILINRSDVQLNELQQEDILELVDYDPIRNILLTIGKYEPCLDAPVHWVIQNARHDVHAVVLVKSKSISEKICKKIPITEHEAPPGTIEYAKEALKTLQKGKQIQIKNNGVLLVGTDLKEIEKSFLEIWGKQ